MTLRVKEFIVKRLPCELIPEITQIQVELSDGTAHSVAQMHDNSQGIKAIELAAMLHVLSRKLVEVSKS